jgi:protein-L-isoaspartate(D-aspartate) O-methyltransferase
MDIDFEAAKQQMLERQLQRRGIADSRVLAAMKKLPRERFIAPKLQADAYSDNALPIDCEQTISQPYIVALMTQALELTGGEKVLEIGTGSGYQAGILAELVREVTTVERHERLSRQAESVLTALGYANIAFVVGDGTLGYQQSAPYDRIICTAMAAECPPKLFEQLNEGGILVIPLGNFGQQTLQAIRKTDGVPHAQSLSPCRFVPLIGAHGWNE